MPGALTAVECQPLDLNRTLLHLQELIGRELRISVNAYGRFFGAGLVGELRSVQTLPPDGRALRIELDGDAGLFLDPVEIAAFLYRGPGGEEWLEIEAAVDFTVTIEASA